MKKLWSKIKKFSKDIWGVIKRFFDKKEEDKQYKVESSMLIIYNKLYKVSKGILYNFNKKI